LVGSHPDFWFEPAMVNVGELQRRGISLYTHEVVAIVCAVCEQLGRAQRSFGALRPPTPDDLSVDRRGELLMRTQPVGGDESPFPALASLIEGLLPACNESADCAISPAFRLIPARLLGEAGVPAITSLRELEETIERYETDEPSRVLQQLVVRVANAEGVPAVKPTANEAADLPVTVSVDAENPLDSFPTEAAAVAKPADGSNETVLTPR
jgi:hypothetical protein